MHVEIASKDTRRVTTHTRCVTARARCWQRTRNVHRQQHRLTRDDARLQSSSVMLGERYGRSNDEHIESFDECRHRGDPLTTCHRGLRKNETLDCHTCFDCCTHTKVRHTNHRQPGSGPRGCRRDGECHAQRSITRADHRTTTHHSAIGEQRQQRWSNGQWGTHGWHAETRAQVSSHPHTIANRCSPHYGRLGQVQQAVND